MNDDFLDIGGMRVDADQKTAALNEARLYFDAFVTNPAGAEILKRWTERDFHEPVGVDSSIQRYAAVEARRDFIRRIHQWINVAKTGGT